VFGGENGVRLLGDMIGTRGKGEKDSLAIFGFPRAWGGGSEDQDRTKDVSEKNVVDSALGERRSQNQDMNFGGEGAGCRSCGDTRVDFSQEGRWEKRRKLFLWGLGKERGESRPNVRPSTALHLTGKSRTCVHRKNGRKPSSLEKV